MFRLSTESFFKTSMGHNNLSLKWFWGELDSHTMCPFPPTSLALTFFSSSICITFVTHRTGSYGAVSAFTMGKKRAKAKHRRPFRVDDQEAPSDGICADEGHCGAADSLMDGHLSLREKMPLVDLDLVLDLSSMTAGTSWVVDTKISSDSSLSFRVL